MKVPGRRFFAAFLMMGLLAGTFAGCANVRTLNTLVRNDPGAELIANNVAYGIAKRQTLDIYAPEIGGTNLPVMVFVYGGSWKNGKKEDYSFAGHAFASKGYITVLIDYRLVPDVTYPAFVDDTVLALAWVSENINKYRGDGQKIFVGGHSAGAYNAVMAVMSQEAQARVQFDPAGIVGVIGLAGPYDFLPLKGEVTRNAFGRAQDLPATQPINLVREGLPAFFLATGTGDTTVKQRNTEELAKRLKAVGVPVTEHYYDGLTHADTLTSLTTKYRGKSSEYADILAFMKAVLTPQEVVEALAVEEPAEPEEPKKDVIRVSLDEKGLLWMDGVQIKMADLQPLLKDELGKYPNANILIRAADNLDNETILEMVRQVKEVGPGKFSMDQTH